MAAMQRVSGDRGPSWRRLRRGLALGVLGVIAAGCASGSTVDTSVDSSLGFQPGDGAVVYETGHRHLAGDVSGTTLAGKPLSLSSLRGKVVVVNFWSSSCGPCVGEAEYFDQVAKDDARDGVAFVGIDVRDQSAQAKAFEADHHVPYPSLFDPGGLLALRFPHAEPDTTPTTIVLDRSGHIAAKVSGALDYTHLRSLVNTVSAERT
jgi:thiol-disulfide isomerase/thioredoxin